MYTTESPVDPDLKSGDRRVLFLPFTLRIRVGRFFDFRMYPRPRALPAVLLLHYIVLFVVLVVYMGSVPCKPPRRALLQEGKTPTAPPCVSLLSQARRRRELN